jgi:hypothetical protein
LLANFFWYLLNCIKFYFPKIWVVTGYLLHRPQNNLSQAKEHLQVDVDSCSSLFQPLNHPGERQRGAALGSASERLGPSSDVHERRHVSFGLHQQLHHFVIVVHCRRLCKSPNTLRAWSTQVAAAASAWAARRGEAAARWPTSSRQCYEFFARWH